MAAIAAGGLIAGCGSSGGGATTPSAGTGTPATPVVSSSGAGVQAETGSGGGSSAGSGAVAGSLSKQSVGRISHGSTSKFSHASTSTFSVSHAHTGAGTRSSGVLSPNQSKQAQQHTTTTTAPASTPPPKAPPTTTPAPPPARTPPKTRVVVVTRYKVHTVYRTRTITKTVTKTVPPKLPAGAFMPSKHPLLGQRAFTVSGANLGCKISSAGVRCGVVHRSWLAPRKPSSCRSAWGFTIALPSARGLAKFACGGSSPIDVGAKVIPSGWDDTVGRITCQVRSFGVNCFNSTSRSGFLLSRTAYTLY